MSPLENEDLALRLEEIAELLEAQHANPFRVRAYRNAAQTVRAQPRSVHALLAEGGLEALVALPGIGRSLARTLEQLVHTGRIELLDRLRGGSGAAIFETVPGIGRTLACLIHDTLGIESLAELELAAHDGRLASVPGMGKRRLAAVRQSLAGRLRRAPRTPHVTRAQSPPVDELLDVDREYRERAAAGDLPRITPRRFNPEHEAWLPVLHTRRAGHHYTALFSNTARAHELGTIHDWVVLYRDDDGDDGQWTVVTEHRGALRGRRVVRGRENECSPRAPEPAAVREDAS